MDNQLVEQRKGLWLALADFYLDTELLPAELDRIRAVFHQSGLTEAVIRRINYEEVAPVLLPNLRGVAGVWGGFNQQWVLEQITNRLNRPRGRYPWRLFSWLWRRQVDYYTNSYFKAVYRPE